MPITATQLCRQIVELERWSGFRGWGPLPGIREARFERRTDDAIGSRIRVINTDGSTHVEEIVEWDPERRLVLRMSEFSPPLSALASHFEERWEFEPSSDRRPELRVVRSFRLHPRSRLARPVLRLIAAMLRRAVARHLTEITAEIAADPQPDHKASGPDRREP